MTDVHGSPAAVGWIRGQSSGYDAVIVGGDLARHDAQPYVDRFMTATAGSGKPVYFVHGNWDRPDVALPNGVVSLHAKSGKLGRFRVGGLGGSNPTPFNAPFEWKDDDARPMLDGLGRVDILVAHAPPAGTKCDRTASGHIGSRAVRDYVLREKPLLVLTGHVHESRGVDRLGESTVVNPGPLKEGRYGAVTLNGVVSVELLLAEGFG